MSDNYDLTGIDLDEALGSDLPTELVTMDTPSQAPGDSPVTTPAGEEPATDDTAGTDENPADQNDPNWNPDGPGNVRIALQQARESERRAREDAALVRQQLAQFQQHQQALQTQANENARARQIQDALEMGDEATAQALLQQHQQEAQAQYEQRLVMDRLNISEEAARRAVPDYDERMQRFQTVFGQEGVQWALSQPNPAFAALNRLEGVFTKDDLEAAKAAAKAEALADLQARKTPQKSQAPRQIGQLPAASAPDEDAPQSHRAPKVAVDQMTAEQLQKWHDRALRGV